VLILSEFAGAAKELSRAVLINPHEIDGVAAALKVALEMPLAERRSRHAPMLEYLVENDIRNWADSYLSALSASARGRGLLDGIRAFFAGNVGQRRHAGERYGGAWALPIAALKTNSSAFFRSNERAAAVKPYLNSKRAPARATH
jgi:hypothetical protein